MLKFYDSFIALAVAVNYFFFTKYVIDNLLFQELSNEMSHIKNGLQITELYSKQTNKQTNKQPTIHFLVEFFPTETLRLDKSK
jgi:hypothetical protein